jgi:hypothetical protein
MGLFVSAQDTPAQLLDRFAPELSSGIIRSLHPGADFLEWIRASSGLSKIKDEQPLTKQDIANLKAAAAMTDNLTMKGDLLERRASARDYVEANDRDCNLLMPPGSSPTLPSQRRAKPWEE